MIDGQELQATLHRSFTDAIAVRPVPFGFAINSPFYDQSGDSLAFYARETGDGLVLEDDGAFLPHLVASGIDIQSGQRRNMLDAILAESGAHWDETTYEISTDPVSPAAAGLASVRFLSGLLRLRSLEQLTRETVRSTFKEDATAAIEDELAAIFDIRIRASIAPDLAEYPADIVLVNKTDKERRLGIFLVNNATQFLEAELLYQQIDQSGRAEQLVTVALIEDTRKITAIGDRRYQRAVNHGLLTRFFRGTEHEAVQSLQRLAA